MGSSDKKGRESFSDFALSDEESASGASDDEEEEEEAVGSGGGAAAAAAAAKPKGGEKRKQDGTDGTDATIFDPLENLTQMLPWTDFTAKAKWNPAVLVYMHEVVKNEPALNPFLVRLLSTPLEGNGAHVHKKRRSTARAVEGTRKAAMAPSPRGKRRQTPWRA